MKSHQNIREGKEKEVGKFPRVAKTKDQKRIRKGLEKDRSKSTGSVPDLRRLKEKASPGPSEEWLWTGGKYKGNP